MSTQALDIQVSSLLEYGVSSELRDLLAAIGDATLANGEPRYAQRSMDELRRKILCYNYGETCFELAHWLAAITHFGDGLDETLWFEEAVTADRFRDVTNGWDGRGAVQLSRNGNALIIDVEGEPFELHMRRVNVMAAWVELLLFVVPGLHEQLTAFEGGLSSADIRRCARELQQQLYGFLKEQLQPQNRLRQCWHLLQWLRGTREGSFDTYDEALGDDDLLRFWGEQVAGEGKDFRRFTSVGELGFHLLTAIDAGRQRWELDHAASHSMTDEEGSAWLDGFAEQGFEPDDEDLALLHLCDFEEAACATPGERLASGALADIKFLTARELSQATALERPAGLLQRLPLTHVRMVLFGAQQAAITGDLQNGGGANLESLAACADMTGADEWRQALAALASRIERTRLAIGYILLEHDRPDAISMLCELFPALRASLAGEGEVPETPVAWVKEHHAPVVAECASAFKESSRKGFKALPASDEIEAYIEGDEVLAELSDGWRRVDAIVADYSGRSMFDRDKEFFAAQFSKLYAANVMSEA